MPPASLRIMPARVINRWLTISASEGASLRVAMWKREAFMGWGDSLYIIDSIVRDRRGAAMLDRDGYRPNVGIILVNSRNEVFWGKRIREHSWQFPQGGIKRGESPEQAMY